MALTQLYCIMKGIVVLCESIDLEVYVVPSLCHYLEVDVVTSQCFQEKMIARGPVSARVLGSHAPHGRHAMEEGCLTPEAQSGIQSGRIRYKVDVFDSPPAPEAKTPELSNLL